jgi:AcrR family transcriptional regulator
MEKKAVARAGRPRDENVHRAILEAARNLIRDDGYASFSIEGVAARAGVAKQSIYRRWSSKGALLVDLYMDGLERPVPARARGFASDLLDVLSQTTKRVQDPTYANILKSVVVEAQTDPDMRQLVLEKIVDFLFGAIWFNLLLGDADFKLLARRIVNMIELLGSKRR